MSNAARPDDKAKKNKNKKKKNQEGNAEPSLGGLGGALGSNVFNQLNALMSQEIPVDFEKFDEHEKRVREEMGAIQDILSNIQANKFDSFPDEPKKENVGSTGGKPELDAHRKMLLNELNKKIGIFEERLQKLDNLAKEAQSDPQLQKILSGLRENLTDDINRNRDLYRRFETNAS